MENHFFSIGTPVSRREALVEAQAFIEELGFSQVISNHKVVGSIRRKVEVVKNIDIVVTLPESLLSLETLKEFWNRYFQRKYVSDSILRGLTESFIQINLYIATEENFGAQVLYWTGSKESNERMERRSKRKGFRNLNRYGLFSKDNECVASKREEDIFEALGMKFVLPENRN